MIQAASWWLVSLPIVMMAVHQGPAQKTESRSTLFSNRKSSRP